MNEPKEFQKETDIFIVSTVVVSLLVTILYFVLL